MEYKKSVPPYRKEPVSSAAYRKREEYRLPEARKTLRARKRKNAVKAFLIVAVLLVIAGWLLFDKLFVIRKFRIDGQKEYTQEQAQAAAENIGIKKGGHIFGFDKKSVEENAKYILAEFDKVEIAFDLPDTVVLKVSESVPVMYTVFGENGYMLSEELKVISAVSDPSECEDMALTKIETGNITKCVAGEFLTVDGTGGDIVKNLYAVLKEEGVVAEITEIDVSDKFDITIEYGKRFSVKLGDEKNLTVKIRYMKAIIGELAHDDSGVIDVSDDEYRDATFKAYSKM